MDSPTLFAPGRPVWRYPRARRRHLHRSAREPDPTFLIIGAQKAGTTWLHEMLDRHPQIYAAPAKEVRYFYRRALYRRGREWYRSHFHGAQQHHRALGEATPNYLWASPHRNDEWGDPRRSAQAISFRLGMPERIAGDLGTDLRLVVLLRDPVQRAISAFYHHLRRPGRIDRSKPFMENARRSGIVQMGFYAAHLERWLSVFPSERFLVLGTEEMRAYPDEALRRIHRHLGVTSRATPGLGAEVHVGQKHGEQGVWYWDETRRDVAIGPDEIAALREVYEPENDRLARLLGRDLWPAR